MLPCLISSLKSAGVILKYLVGYAYSVIEVEVVHIVTPLFCAHSRARVMLARAPAYTEYSPLAPFVV
jgi:hypothetical protein